MSKRGVASSGDQAGMMAEPPAAPLQEAAAAAASKPNPIPDTDTSRGGLEASTAWLPAALQPAAMLAVGLAKAAWTALVPMARIGYRLVVWSSPVLVWAFWKYANWYFLGWLTKAQRVFKWGNWLLSFFTKAPPAA